MPKLSQGETFSLTIGTEINFLSDTKSKLTYVVESINPTTPTLVLRRTSSENNLPETILIDNQNSTIGRKILINQFVSNQHAQITWDKENNCFVYKQLGINSAIITPPQILEIHKLTKTLEDKGAQLDQVSDLEQGSQNLRAKFGGKSEDSLEGYALYLQAYLLLNKHSLDSTNEIPILEKLIKTFIYLKSERKLLRHIQETPYYQRHLAVHPDNNKTHYSGMLGALIQEKIKELEKHGEIYTLSGFKKHLAIGKITLHPDGSSYYTIYNAGAEAPKAEIPETANTETPKAKMSDMVMGTYERKIKKTSDIPKLLWTIYEKTLRNPLLGVVYENLAKQLDEFLEPTPTKSRLTTRQHAGYCTTRSPREVIFDLLPSKVEEIHSFVKQGARNAIAQLQSRLYKLENGEPLTQENVEEPIAEQRTHQPTVILQQQPPHSPMWEAPQPSLSCSGEYGRATKRQKTGEDTPFTQVTPHVC